MICKVCLKPVEPGQPTRKIHGETVHKPCRDMAAFNGLELILRKRREEERGRNQLLLRDADAA